MRNADIEALLRKVQKQIVSIEGQESVGELDEVDIKNTLENLRSALEYLAQDISDHLHEKWMQSPARVVYMPYGISLEKFRKNVAKNLPGLEIHRSDIFDVLINYQPFNGFSPWLSILCDRNNNVKHDRVLGTNAVSPFISINTPFGNFGQFPKGASVRIENNYVDGVRCDEVFVDQQGNVEHRIYSLNTVVFKKEKIIFSGSHIQVVNFLKYTLSKIKEMKNAVYLLGIE